MKIVVLDTETTGLDRTEDEPVSIAMIDGDGNVIIDTLVKPLLKRSWAEAQQIHGISPEDVKDAPYMVSILPTIRKAIEEADLVVGYNLEFDIHMLRQLVESSKQFDVMREFAKVHGQIRNDGSFKWSKLSECAEYYGYEFLPHGALGDCKATLHCYNALMRDGEYLAFEDEKKKQKKRGVDMDVIGYCLKIALGIITGLGGIVITIISFGHMFDGTMLAWMIAGLLLLVVACFLLK